MEKTHRGYTNSIQEFIQGKEVKAREAIGNRSSYEG
jgi:hypothetical protein